MHHYAQEPDFKKSCAEMQGERNNMKVDKKKREKRLNLIGMACGLFVLIVGLVTGILKSLPATAGVRDSEIPATAQKISMDQSVTEKPNFSSD